MTYAPCKAADLKEGDRVRVTLEGVVLDTIGKPPHEIPYARISCGAIGSADVVESFWFSVLDAGKLEREERPLQVGDVVRISAAHQIDPRLHDGAVVFVSRQRAVVVEWPDGAGVYVYKPSELQPVAP